MKTACAAETEVRVSLFFIKAHFEFDKYASECLQ